MCGLITPWNWPINQIACKVAPALAAGCTMVLKPSEIAPLAAIIFAEILDEAGVPAGRVQPRERRRPDGRAGDRRRIPRSTWSRSQGRRAPASRSRRPRRHHGQARGAGARRQVAEHHPARRRLRESGAVAGVAALLREQRSVLQRADPHARAEPTPRRGDRGREGGGASMRGRRPGSRRHRARAGREPGRSSTRSSG